MLLFLRCLRALVIRGRYEMRHSFLYMVWHASPISSSSSAAALDDKQTDSVANLSDRTIFLIYTTTGAVHIRKVQKIIPFQKGSRQQILPNYQYHLFMEFLIFQSSFEICVKTVPSPFGQLIHAEPWQHCLSSSSCSLGQVVEEVVEPVGRALPLHLHLAVDLLVVLRLLDARRPLLADLPRVGVQVGHAEGPTGALLLLYHLCG